MDIKSIGNTPLPGYEFASNAVAVARNTAALPASEIAEQQDVEQPSAVQLNQTVAGINQTMQNLAPGLEFSIDQESNRTIVKVIDQQTKELIRQMPSAEALEIAKALDRVQGLLISLRA